MKTETDKVRRYEAALHRVIYQARIWKQQIDAAEETGRGVTGTDRAIMRAYLDAASPAAMALGMSRRQLIRRLGAKRWRAVS